MGRRLDVSNPEFGYNYLNISGSFGSVQLPLDRMFFYVTKLHNTYVIQSVSGLRFECVDETLRGIAVINFLQAHAFDNSIAND